MSDKSVSQGIISGGNVRGGGGSPATTAQLEAFPPARINWVEDSANDLWEKPGAELAFRMDFMTSGYTKLMFFKSIFAGGTQFSPGKFAIYGNGLIKLVEDSVPSFSSYGRADFASIDISDYDWLAVCMDPGLSGIPQPVMQSIEILPTNTGLSRNAFAGMFEHVHDSPFPDEAPTIIGTDIKYFLARWCAIGVQ